MHETPSILALIPARAGSKGIPGKNTRLLNGRPLLQYSCQCALGTRSITRTVVSTDCPGIAAVAREAGAEVPFLRPTNLAGDQSPTLGVIQHALAWLHAQQQWEPAVVVLLQPTAPFRTSSDVDAAVDTLMASEADSIVSVCSVSAHYHPDWQFSIHQGTLQRWAGGSIGSTPTRRQLLEPTYVRNGAIYAFRPHAIRTSGSIYGQRCLAFEMPSERSINIDSPADWLAAERYLRSNQDLVEFGSQPTSGAHADTSSEQPSETPPDEGQEPEHAVPKRKAA